ncbi:MAG: translation elongation factor Ts [Candidatus Uhrbacteria bacterium]
MTDAKTIMQLRQITGAGIMDAKQALDECGGDIEAAKDVLRKKGQAKAAKKAGRETAEGLVGSYIHANGKLGVLVEIACETDFVARGDEFKTLVSDIAMHIAAADPQYLSREEVPQDIIAKEHEIATGQAAGKPADMLERIVGGKLDKFYAENCLLEQEYIKDDSLTVQQRVEQAIAKIGENIQVRRFCRFAL